MTAGTIFYYNDPYDFWSLYVVSLLTFLLSIIEEVSGGAEFHIGFYTTDTLIKS